MIEQFILIGFAAWRMAHLLVGEDGPIHIFERIRDISGANKPGEITGFLPMLFSCIYCMSVWTTIFAYLLWQIDPIIVMILAAMSLSLVVNRLAKIEGV